MIILMLFSLFHLRLTGKVRWDIIIFRGASGTGRKPISDGFVRTVSFMVAPGRTSPSKGHEPEIENNFGRCGC